MLPSTRQKGDVLPASQTRTRSQAGSPGHWPRLTPGKAQGMPGLPPGWGWGDGGQGQAEARGRCRAGWANL